jgi:hypothetical protein
MNLSVPDHSLLVFVDDTGHEAIAPGHPVYGPRRLRGHGR